LVRAEEERPLVRKTRENTTVWEAPSPKFIMGSSGEDKYDHRGERVYEPFLGSGTTLAVAEQSGRLCCGMDLDPRYVDVVVERWQTLSGQEARLEGDGRSFAERASARRGPRGNAGAGRPGCAMRVN